MHLSICALLLACGGGNGIEPSDLETPDPDPPTPPTFTVVGHGELGEPLTSDLWVHGTVAYTGMVDLFGTGAATNALQVWDVSNPAMPRLATSLEVAGAGGVFDVKIRADGTLGVITHQGSDDQVNGLHAHRPE